MLLQLFAIFTLHHYLPSALTANKILPDHLSQEDSFFITANMALIRLAFRLRLTQHIFDDKSLSGFTNSFPDYVMPLC